jgi:deferrochelatase/peroxidase EfeB
MGKENKGISRRDMLKMSVVTGTSLAIGAGGLGFVSELTKPKEKVAEADMNDIIPFYGPHQAGISAPQQKYSYLAAFDLKTTRRDQVIQLLKDWTKQSELFTAGNWEQNSSNNLLPPDDTGETVGLSANNLTITFGFGPTFFSKDGVDRFGIATKQPKHLKVIPHMPHDNLDESISNGDLCIQVCSNNQQVAFHAIRNFINQGISSTAIRWIQSGFIEGPSGETPRNLFGFKDGTANRDPKSSGFDSVVWAGENEPKWMQGGTYLTYRKIRMFLEIWDRDSLQDHEDTFGRKKQSGAPYGKVHEKDTVDPSKMPADSHVGLIARTGKEIFRKGYSYTNGIDPKTGNVQAGLMFVSFQKNPDDSLIPMLRLLSERDTLNEYTQHIASAMFACPRGIKKGEYIAQSLFEE